MNFWMICKLIYSIRTHIFQTLIPLNISGTWWEEELEEHPPRVTWAWINFSKLLWVHKKPIPQDSKQFLNARKERRLPNSNELRVDEHGIKGTLKYFVIETLILYTSLFTCYLCIIFSIFVHFCIKILISSSTRTRTTTTTHTGIHVHLLRLYCMFTIYLQWLHFTRTLMR